MCFTSLHKHSISSRYIFRLRRLSSSNLDAEKEKLISKQIDLYPDCEAEKIVESYDKTIAVFRRDIMPLFSELRIRIRADVDYNSAMPPLT